MSSLRFESSPCLLRVDFVDVSLFVLLRLTQFQAQYAMCAFLLAYCFSTNGTFVTMAGTALLRIMMDTGVPGSACSVGT